MKCLPTTKLPLSHGTALHDWHAEVLAIRAFNRFLLDHILLTLTLPPPAHPSPFLRRRSNEEIASTSPTHETQPFTIEDDVTIFMYCSEAPCGDASMELVMDAQEDATPWSSPVPTITAASCAPGVVREGVGGEEEDVAGLRGRSHFAHLGALRYKPSRPDAPPTLSKSCTDKLALNQSTSLLASLTSLLISPRNAYVATLVLPKSQLVPSACERAFSRTGRMNGVTDEMTKGWQGGYKWSGFEVRGTEREFMWSRRAVGQSEKAVASNMSALWTPNWQETLIGGVLQGRKQFDPRGASSICRRSVWQVAAQVAAIAAVPMLIEALEKKTYKEVKQTELLAPRRKVKDDVRKAALKGWVQNVGDDAFGLESSLQS
ncbi:hypothetical protein CC80DRAFT_490928 [Byssothecium circinans]|uniref:A to I editase domain-containing protein n=1 Tax=Byssothecium circinans TaxID=147558 RepID=A0A6A5U0A2_9PLEO|nr:hypothetical protein CC80DRAFT_490928 [Byssothecium circinans]